MVFSRISADNSHFSVVRISVDAIEAKNTNPCYSAVGARNFLFISVPPLERTPIALEAGNDDSHAVEAAVIAGYNSRLSARAAAFKAANEGVSYLNAHLAIWTDSFRLGIGHHL